METPNSTPGKMTPAELRSSLQALIERLDQIEADISALRDGLALATTASPLGDQPQPAPASPGHREASCQETTDFIATILLVGVDDNGLPTYKAKGGQYMKFGVRIWPEVLPELSIEPASLKPGPNPVNLHLLALLGDKGPRKVIGLAR